MLKPNRKTRWSCEPSESCLQRLFGKPCNYCYTLHPWNGASRRTGPPKLFQPFQPGSIALLQPEELNYPSYYTLCCGFAVKVWVFHFSVALVLGGRMLARRLK